MYHDEEGERFRLQKQKENTGDEWRCGVGAVRQSRVGCGSFVHVLPWIDRQKRPEVVLSPVVRSNLRFHRPGKAIQLNCWQKQHIVEMIARADYLIKQLHSAV